MTFDANPVLSVPHYHTTFLLEVSKKMLMSHIRFIAEKHNIKKQHKLIVTNIVYRIQAI